MSKIETIYYRAMRDKEYIDLVKDILFHDEVKKLKNFLQHMSVSRYEHSVNVSYVGYLLAKKFHLDMSTFARAGLLHDMFFYDWKMYKNTSHSIFKSHFIYHGTVALENARKYFNLNKKEQEMIKKHMWPATIIPPRYLETYIIGFIDKYCAVYEYICSKISIHEKVLITSVKY